MSAIDFSFNNIRVKLVETQEELDKALRLRYEELILLHRDAKDISFEETFGADDKRCDNLIAIDTDTGEVVGSYRLITTQHLSNGVVERFACESTFNVDAIKRQPFASVELGRAVVEERYRDGLVIKLLFKGIFEYVKLHNIRLLFGIIYIPPIAEENFKNLMEYCNTKVLDKETLPIFALEPSFDIHMLKEGGCNVIQAKKDLPPILKAYMSMGCRFVPTGCVKDKLYDTSGVMIVLDFKAISPRYLDLVTRF